MKLQLWVVQTKEFYFKTPQKLAKNLWIQFLSPKFLTFPQKFPLKAKIKVNAKIYLIRILKLDIKMGSTGCLSKVKLGMFLWMVCLKKLILSRSKLCQLLRKKKKHNQTSLTYHAQSTLSSLLIFSALLNLKKI